MSVKKWFILCSIVIFSTAAYAQRGVTKAVETAVERQVFNRAQLPTLRDGMRNLVTRRLGNVHYVKLPAAVQPEQRNLVWEKYPTRSVFEFKDLLKLQTNRPALVSPITQMRPEKRKRDFYQAAKPGSGHIRAIALPAKIFVERVAMEENLPQEDRNILLQMVEVLDHGFDMTPAGEWKLYGGVSFSQIHRLIEHLKTEWPTYNDVYHGSGQPLPASISAALDVIDIQTWMLEHEGAFPQSTSHEPEALLVWKFEKLMNQIATNPTLAQDRAMQTVVQHLVHLRAAANGAMTPVEVVADVLKRVDAGGRVPGSSLVQVTPEENVLTQELNYVEQLRRANLLYLVVPMQRTQDVLELHLADLQEKGRIYRQMIARIPEFAHDGLTLNVPTSSHIAWGVELNTWQAARKAAGQSTTPRNMIPGRFGLPINFNDLTKEEQTEVLLGTYLKIK